MIAPPARNLSLVRNVFALLVISTVITQAQDQLPPGVGRDLIVSFRRATALMDSGDTRSGLTLLHGVFVALDDADDVLIPAADGQLQSLRNACAGRLRDMSEPDARFYESQFGPEARQALEEARRSGNQEELRAVSRRFFFTQAGIAATRELALRQLDQGDALQAALDLTRLKQDGRRVQRLEPALSANLAMAWARAGHPDEARRVLRGLAASGTTAVPLSGEPVDLTDEARWQEWLPDLDDSAATREWPVFLGNARRARESESVVPRWEPLWTSETLQSYVIEGVTEQAEADGGFAEMKRELISEQRVRSRAEFSVVPAVSPLVVDDRVVYRSPITISALRLTPGAGLQQGELEWESYKADPFVIRAFRAFADRDDSPVRAEANSYAWEDLTSGTLSSDGEFVYAIEETDRLTGAFTVRGRRSAELTPEPNYLRAYRLDGGSVAWQIGGEDGIRVAGLRDAVFLGAPLPFGRDLVLIVASRDEIRLLQLTVRNADQPEPDIQVVWSQQLGRIDTQSGLSQVSTLSGLSPSYGGGVLVCPTGSGELVAVDPATRSLRWKFRFAEPEGLFSINGTRRLWSDAAVRIVGNRVLYAPRTGDVLHCLNLDSGAPEWSNRCRGGLYAVTTSDAVVVVTASQARAFGIADGETLWSEPVPLDGPTGRGLVHDDRFSVPLSGGVVVTIDLRTGRRLAEVSTSVELGNLIAVGGVIVSQSPTQVAVFPGLDSVQRAITQGLAATPNDVDLLITRALLRLQSDNLEGGLLDLREAVRLDEKSAAATILLRTVTNLRGAEFRQYVSLLEGIVPEPARVASIDAAGVSGPATLFQSVESFLDQSPSLRIRLMELSEAESLSPERAAEMVEGLAEIARHTSTGRVVFRRTGSIAEDRYLASRVREAIEKARPAAREALVRAIEDQLREELRARPDFAVALLEWLPPADWSEAVVEAVAERMLAAAPERSPPLLERLSRSEDADRRFRANRRLVSVFRERRPDLTRELIESVRRDAETHVPSRELMREWRTDPLMAPLVRAEPAWPGRPVVRQRGRAVLPARVAIASQGQAGRGGWLFAREKRGIVALDSRLQEQFLVPLGPVENQRFSGRVPLVIERSDVVVLALGPDNFSAYDVLSPPGQPQLLWTRQLDVGGDRGLGANNLLGSGYPPAVGPVAGRTLLYRHDGHLIAADLRTGRTLWTRRVDLRFRSVVADESTVAVVSRLYGGSVVFYSVFDGTQLGEQPLVNPAGDQRVGIGRGLVVVENVETAANEPAVNVAFVNYGEDRPLWQHQFAAGAALSNAANGFAAVAEPQGRITMLHLQSGRIISRMGTQPVPGLKRASLHVSPDHFVVFTDQEREEDRFRQVPGIRFRGGDLTGWVSGVAVGIDRRSGKKVWEQPVENERLARDRFHLSPAILAANSPVVVLVDPNRGNRFRILDCGTGEDLYRSTEPAIPPFGVLDARREQRVINLQIGPHNLELEYPPEDVPEAQ